MINTKAPSILEVPGDLDESVELVIVLSTHKSKIHEKVMTAHYPGNWDKAEMKGEPRTLVKANASALKILLQEIKKEADKIGWSTTLEADHHGPTGKTPMIFVEIGSTEEEWNDEKAAEGMAKALMVSFERIERVKAGEEKFESCLIFGGGHYPKKATELVLGSEFAISHICPKYAIDKLDDEMFRQAIKKNVEVVKRVFVLKEGTNVAQKEKIRALCEKFNVRYEII